MTDYICPGCDNPIDEGQVLIGRNQYRKEGSTPVILHAGNAKRSIDIAAMADSTSCVAKYFAKAPGNNLYEPKLILLSELKNMVD